MVRVTVTQFTDPFCTWCWGAEPIRRRLQEVYREQLRFEYVMGGLVEDFAEFHDPGGASDRAGQVAPHWATAAQRHGMPVNTSLWESQDRPESSYPANIAYEAATFQGRPPANTFLRRMREAAHAEGRNVSNHGVQDELANRVGLDVDQFRSDRTSEKAREAFEADLRRTRGHGATSLPTFHVDVDGQEEVFRGYRPYVTFEKFFAEQAPDLVTHEPRSLSAFLERYGRVATREVGEVYGLSDEEANTALEEIDGAQSIAVGNGKLWTAE